MIVGRHLVKKNDSEQRVFVDVKRDEAFSRQTWRILY